MLRRSWVLQRQLHHLQAHPSLSYKMNPWSSAEIAEQSPPPTIFTVLCNCWKGACVSWTFQETLSFESFSYSLELMSQFLLGELVQYRENNTNNMLLVTQKGLRIWRDFTKGWILAWYLQGSIFQRLLNQTFSTCNRPRNITTQQKQLLWAVEATLGSQLVELIRNQGCYGPCMPGFPWKYSQSSNVLSGSWASYMPFT